MNIILLTLDVYIQDQECKSINEIFADDGEDYFRKIEKVYLHRVIKTKNVVISVGGGTPCYFDNMELMNEYGLTIYINMHLLNLYKITIIKSFRPLIAGLQENELLILFIKHSMKERVFIIRHTK